MVLLMGRWQLQQYSLSVFSQPVPWVELRLNITFFGDGCCAVICFLAKACFEKEEGIKMGKLSAVAADMMNLSVLSICETRPSRRPHMIMFWDFTTENVITFQCCAHQWLRHLKPSLMAFWYRKTNNSNLMFSEQWRFNFKLTNRKKSMIIDRPSFRALFEGLEDPEGSPLIALFMQTELVFPRPRSMTSPGLLLGAPYGGFGTTACLLWSGCASNRSLCVPSTLHYSRRNWTLVGKNVMSYMSCYVSLYFVQ